MNHVDEVYDSEFRDILHEQIEQTGGAEVRFFTSASRASGGGEKAGALLFVHRR